MRNVRLVASITLWPWTMRSSILTALSWLMPLAVAASRKARGCSSPASVAPPARIWLFHTATTAAVARALASVRAKLNRPDPEARSFSSSEAVDISISGMTLIIMPTPKASCGHINCQKVIWSS